MLTVCPYPECRYEHSYPADAKSFSICPKCQRPGALRAPEIWRLIRTRAETYDRQHAADIKFEKPGRVCCAVLEDIRSLWNVGSMFRTADAMGLEGLYLAGITGSPPRKEIAKTSLGAEEHVPWRYVGHSLDILPALKSQGITVLALERCKNSKPISDIARLADQSQRIALVVGNEVTGVSPETLAACDDVVDLPMCGMKESLNVAVAFGVAAYAFEFFLPGSLTAGSIAASGKATK
jgi:23S rRNA (guanosine2251-2'-O)-methyltransferase